MVLDRELARHVVLETEISPSESKKGVCNVILFPFYVLGLQIKIVF